MDNSILKTEPPEPGRQDNTGARASEKPGWEDTEDGGRLRAGDGPAVYSFYLSVAKPHGVRSLR